MRKLLLIIFSLGCVYAQAQPMRMLLLNKHATGGGAPTTDITTLSGGSASASDFFGGFPASNCVDKDLTTKWAVISGLPVWWQWDAGSGNTRTPVKGTFRTLATGESSESVREPYTFEWRGSNDGSFATYTTLVSVSANSYTSDVVKSFDFTTTGTFRYFRLYITANQPGSGNSFIQLSEITLMQ